MGLDFEEWLSDKHLSSMELEFSKDAFAAGAASRDAEVAKWKSIAANKADQVDAAKEVIAEVKQERDQLREQVKLLRDALLTCSVGDFSTGHVIYPSFDEKLVEEALAATKADLGGLILCEKEPVVEIAASGKPYVVGDAPPGTVCYRAKNKG